MYYTYILKCKDNSYYVGSTENLKNRLKTHNLGKGANYTLKRLPCFMVWFKEFSSRNEAVKEELRIKKISRQKKEKLIFSPGTVWEHFKGNKYIIIEVFGDLICYCDNNLWKDFLRKQKLDGEEIQVWLRNKSQWLDIKEINNKKLLRFNLSAD